jgi:hypothetical protein
LGQRGVSLEYLVSAPALRAALSAPDDDEPVTEGDADAISRAMEDIKAGRTVSRDVILREFGVK